jgi:hypothetical protein
MESINIKSSSKSKCSIILETQTDPTFEAILYNTYNYVDICEYSIIHNTHNSTKINLAIKPGCYNIVYNDKNITVNYLKFGPPLSLENVTKYHKEVEIISDNIDILKEFIKDSRHFYNEYIRNKVKVDNKLNLYLWDTNYWDSITKKNKRPISTVCYKDNIHLDLLDDIKYFLSDEEEKEYLEYGIPYKFNVLLEGYPGTGKTSLVMAIASELDLNIATITFDHELTDKCFFKALTIIPKNTILLLEDIDVLFKERKEADTGKSALTFSGLLNNLDGIGSINRLIVFMTTNYCCNLDSALKRPGRVDKTIHFGYSDKEQIQTMYNKFLKGRENKFKSFYREIKNYNLTSAILQKYFFENRKEPDLLKNICDIKTLAELQKYDGATNMYS